MDIVHIDTKHYPEEEGLAVDLWTACCFGCFLDAANLPTTICHLELGEELRIETV